MLVMKALRQDVAILAFHPHDALRGLKAHAIPAGQGELRKHYFARRKSVCIFEESPPSVPINGVVLRTRKDGISYSSDYKKAKTFMKLTRMNQNSKANRCE